MSEQTPAAERVAERFARWLEKVDAIGQREGFFDPPGLGFACPGSHARRPYAGEDGIFRQLFESGVPPEFAIGEALAAEDYE